MPDEKTIVTYKKDGEITTVVEQAKGCVTAYTPEQIIEVAEAHHGLINRIATALGVSETSIRRYIAQYPEVRKAIDTSRMTIVTMAESQLLKSVESGRPWAVMFALRTLGKTEGYSERLDLALQAEPIEITVRYVDKPVDSDSDDE